MISIIIPAYREPYLDKTIASLKKNATGKIEILSVDGHWGMRRAINKGLLAARGEFVMKCDAHCTFAPGFDEVLAENCAKNWLLIPRRYSLNEKEWDRNEDKVPFDYHYLSYPKKSRYGFIMSPVNWHKRTLKRRDPKYDIDDTMIFQGSCWFANRDYFMKNIGLLDGKNYGQFGYEQLEVGLKYWLKGGEVKVVKKTWYAHLSKRRGHYKKRMFTRRYKINPTVAPTRTWATKHWMDNKEPNMTHPFSWLIRKFQPPTWPKDYEN